MKIDAIFLMVEWVPYMLTALGSGGITAIIGAIINKRKQSAEANDVEIKSSVIINKEWQNIYESLKSDFESFKKVTEERSDERDRELMEMKKEFKQVFSQLEECRKGINMQNYED